MGHLMTYFIIGFIYLFTPIPHPSFVDDVLSSKDLSIERFIWEAVSPRWFGSSHQLFFAKMKITARSSTKEQGSFSNLNTGCGKKCEGHQPDRDHKDSKRIGTQKLHQKQVLKGATSQSQNKLLEDTLSTYYQSDSVTAHLTQVKHFSLLEKTETNHGKIYLSNGQLRMEFQKSDDALLSELLIINQSHIWTEKRFSKEFGSSIQVTKINLDQRNKENQAGSIFFLFGDKKPLNQFHISQRKMGGQRVFQLQPKDKKKHPGIVQIEIFIDEKQVKSLSYSDDLENKITYNFNKTYFNKKLPKELFNYSPPKNAAVTTL